MPCSNQLMGLGKLATDEIVFKRKNRWLFKIDDISASGINSLPPSKSARPSISFKEIEAQHLTETVYFPGKPEWKPINLTLYDIKDCENNNEHVIFKWLRSCYDTLNESKWTPACTISDTGWKFKEEQAELILFDGCGSVLERWIFEGVWPQNIEFGELDMASSDIITCDLTLRYDRAYWQAF